MRSTRAIPRYEARAGERKQDHVEKTRQGKQRIRESYHGERHGITSECRKASS